MARASTLISAGAAATRVIFTASLKVSGEDRRDIPHVLIRSRTFAQKFREF
jgi:hypothetical protein